MSQSHRQTVQTLLFIPRMHCASPPEQLRPETFDRDQAITRDTGAALQSSGRVFIVLVFRLAVGHWLLLNSAFSAPTWNRSVFKTGVREITREDTGNLGQETLHCTDRYTVFFILHPSNHILHLSKREKEMQVNKKHMCI